MSVPIPDVIVCAVIDSIPSIEVRSTPQSGYIPGQPTIRYFIATAYSVEGAGASGKWSHPGTVAAERTVLPLNSRIRIYGAGRYSGDYTVEDTGGRWTATKSTSICPARQKQESSAVSG